MDETSIGLLNAARSGSRSAVNTLLDLYRPFVAVLARRAGLAGEADVEDLTQEVLLELFKTLPGFDRRRTGSLRAWLRTVVHNSAARSRGRNLPKLEVAADLVWQNLEDDTAGFDEFVAEIDRAAVVHALWEACKETLSAQQQEIFRLHVLDELDTTEVAERCGVTVNNVWLTKSRVLKRLREIALDFYGVDPFQD